MIVIALRTVLWFMFAVCVYDLIFGHKLLTEALKQKEVGATQANELNEVRNGQYFLIAICTVIGTILYYWTPGGN